MQVALAVDDLDRRDALAECNSYPEMGVDNSRPAVDNHHVAGSHLDVDDYPAIDPFYPSQEGASDRQKQPGLRFARDPNLSLIHISEPTRPY